jgi:hypothetical protein
LSDELIHQLQGLQSDPHQRSKWRSFSQVLKAFWKEDENNAVQSKLENIRSEFILRLAVMNKAKADLVAAVQEEAFNSIDQRTATIIQRLVEAPQEIILALSTQTLDLHRRHDESDALVMSLHLETLAAISTLPRASTLQSARACTIDY